MQFSLRACETLWSARDSFSSALGRARETHWECVSHRLKSICNNTVDNKTCNLNFSVTLDLSDESRERSSPSNSSAELRSCLFSKRSTVAEKFRIAKLVLSLSHPYTFHILLRGGSQVKISVFLCRISPWVCY